MRNHKHYFSGFFMMWVICFASCGELTETPQPDPPAATTIPNHGITIIGAEPGAITCAGDERISLNPDGTFEMPDLRQAGGPLSLDEAAASASLDIIQDPRPGTVILGPGDIEVSFEAREGDRIVDECSLKLELVDRTPPQVQVIGIEPDALFVAPEAVVPMVDVSDSASDVLEIRAFLDGEPYEMGTPIGSVGHHVLTVEAMDASGNLGEGPYLSFEIAPRPRHDAVALVSQYECIEEAEGIVAMDVQIVLAAEAFDVKDINLYTLNLWALNENAFPLNNSPIRLAGSTDPEGGGYMYETAEAVYQMGFWQLQFRAGFEDEALLACPDLFLVTGGGNRGEDSDFDFEAFSPAVVIADFGHWLEEAGLLNDDAQMMPPVEAYHAGCDWKGKQISKKESAAVNRKTKGLFWSKMMDLSASDGRIWGFSFLQDSIYNVTVDVSDTGVVKGEGSYLVWLEGPKYCSDSAKVTCTFTPEFRIRTEINSPAEVYAWGIIDINSQECGLRKTAKGGIQLGNAQPTKVKVSAGASVGKDGPSGQANIEFELNTPHGDTDEDIFDVGVKDPKTVSKAKVGIAFYTRTKHDLTADSAPYDWMASSLAQTNNASKNIKIEAVCDYDSETFNW